MKRSVVEAKRISVSRTELLEFAQGELAFYGLDLSRISSVFLAQMLQFRNHRSIDIFSVTDEVKSLEGIGHKTAARKESAFKVGTPLEGLYYKHFTDPRFVGENLAAEFGYCSGGNKNLSNVVGKLFRKYKGQYINEDFCNAIAYETTIAAMERRARRKGLTGEWIVYAKCKEKRFYLCLAAHEESDEQILARVRDALSFDYDFWRISDNNRLHSILK